MLEEDPVYVKEDWGLKWLIPVRRCKEEEQSSVFCRTILRASCFPCREGLEAACKHITWSLIVLKLKLSCTRGACL